uniref:Uncharacterized protein n=1 Tax=Spironucleus salmonicida TaxID=348837 RepID=V6LXB7_9EUKA|eukprot:EST48893.1 Hypothetical protein SS50377_10864 [Spironucleus salmonicida]
MYFCSGKGSSYDSRHAHPPTAGPQALARQSSVVATIGAGYGSYCKELIPSNYLYPGSMVRADSITPGWAGKWHLRAQICLGLASAPDLPVWFRSGWLLEPKVKPRLRTSTRARTQFGLGWHGDAIDRLLEARRTGKHEQLTTFYYQSSKAPASTVPYPWSKDVLSANQHRPCRLHRWFWRVEIRSWVRRYSKTTRELARLTSSGIGALQDRFWHLSLAGSDTGAYLWVETGAYNAECSQQTRYYSAPFHFPIYIITYIVY